NIEEAVTDVQQDSEVSLPVEILDPLYYDILGVGVNADMKEITENYFKLAEKYYPYQTKGEPIFHNFRKINEAYQVLGDIDVKKWYNEYGYAGIKKVNFI
ncbi:ring-infected erythrocyte surface antigen, putative, partial [Plasmodium reichenowi]